MATAVNIVLADALATPVNHTFIPIGKDQNNVFWFEDQSQASPIGYWRVSADIKRPLPGGPGAKSSADRVIRIKLTMHQPQLETVATNDAGLIPAPTLSYIERSIQEFIIPERAVLQNRKDIRKMSMNLLADAQIIALIELLIPFY